MNPTGVLVRQSELSLRRRNEMFALMQAHYERMSRSVFDEDLSEKQWVILVEDRDTHRLVGFSTQMLMKVEVGDLEINAVFSGDTIIDKDSWGQQQLFQVSGWFLRALMLQYPAEPLYWFLISKGYKTYRFLPVFFNEYFPRYDQRTPSEVQAILDALGKTQGGANYDSRRGVIVGNDLDYRLRPGVADIQSHRLSDPHVQFFASRNPDYVRGDELCCLAPLFLDNFTRTAFRAMGAKPPESVSRQFSSLDVVNQIDAC